MTFLEFRCFEIMNKELLYPAAVDENAHVILINNAEKGISYYCPVCKGEFILRKSGKTGKWSKRPHFSHKSLTANCSLESVLHSSFKKMLISHLEKCKSDKQPFEFNWHCNSCGHINSGNLLENATLIKEEYVLEQCRPDIALIDRNNRVFAVIEVVVTHEPEERVLQYYREKKITLIQINLKSDEELNNVEQIGKKPDIVDLCLNPKCLNSGNFIIDRKILTQYQKCRGCYRPIEKIFILISSYFGKKISYDFTDDEINIVKSIADKKGVNIKIESNKSTGDKHPVIVCLNCQRIRSRYSRRRFRF